MKNEELFDMLTELKIDDEYVDEALTGGSDSRGIKVYAGKTRPMKIIAPVAACLAVFAAAGLIFVNRDKLPINNGNSALSPASSGELTDEEKLDQIFEDFKNRHEDFDVERPGAYLQNSNNLALWGYDSPSHTEFVDMCANIVMSMYPKELQGVVKWQAGDMDIDHDDAHELLLCPQINGKSVKGVGVSVFKKYDHDSDPVYIGSFGADVDTMDFNNCHLNWSENADVAYYFTHSEENGKCVVGVQKLYIENNAVCDGNYLRLVTTYPDDTSSDTQYAQTAYRYGKEISIKELMDEWNTVKTRWIVEDDILPTPNTSSDAHSAKSELVQFLIDKYNVPMTANSLHRVIDLIDINNDGVDETVIEFRNCEQLRGMYVFSADGKLIGEFDLKGERYGFGLASGGYIDTLSAQFSAGIYPYSNNGEEYYCFDTQRIGHKIENGEHWWCEAETNRIVVNEDGTLSSIAVMEENWYTDSERYKINGEEVTQEEFWAEQIKYYNSSKPKQGDPFIW